MSVVNVLMILAICLIAQVQAVGEDDSLSDHNRIRFDHKAPNLVLNANLSADCAKHAKEMAEKKELFHSDDEGKYSENIGGNSRSPRRCIYHWHEEMKFYDFRKSIYVSEAAHFTAMVWKSSKEMGHGQAQDEDGMHYVVTRYYPPGNQYGKFEDNVARKTVIALGPDSSKASKLYSRIKILVSIILLVQKLLF